MVCLAAGGPGGHPSPEADELPVRAATSLPLFPLSLLLSPSLWLKVTANSLSLKRGSLEGGSLRSLGGRGASLFLRRDRERGSLGKREPLLSREREPGDGVNPVKREGHD